MSSRHRIVPPLVVAALVIGALGIVGLAVSTGGTAADAGGTAAEAPPVTPTAPAPTDPAGTPATPTPEPEPTPTFDPADTSASTLDGHGRPWGVVDGYTMFRGNPTRSYYGQGPVPEDPEILWQYPASGQLCATSSDQRGPRQWCGTGWTGQQVVWRRPDGTVEVIAGAYDRQTHFINAATGERTRAPFPTGDLVKGSGTLDPDGYPLYYFGSRDNFYRIIALDRGDPVELWRMGPHAQQVWNNDWDSNGIIVDGILFQGGEDSWFRAVELNRTLDADGLVQVDPEVLVEVPGFDDQLFADIGDRNVSIESSPIIIDDILYVTNSGGLLNGWDISRVREGEMPRVFRYWLGDDADGTLVAGPEGIIYAVHEMKRFTTRSREIGQLIALDPSRQEPRLWGIDVPPPRQGDNGGMWATPAIHGDHLYVPTHAGDLIVVDRHAGQIVWSERIGYHEWSSPLVVDDMLVIALCDSGGLRAYSLRDPANPIQAWEVSLPSGSCIESTPTLFDGRIHLGSRDGRIYAFGDAR